MEIIDVKKSRGRPQSESEAINVRIAQPLLAAVDSFIFTHPFPKPSRPEAVRMLVEQALSIKPVSENSMAEPTIENLQRRCDELEDLVNGLCAYLAIQSKAHGWAEVDVEDKAIQDLLKPMLRPERRLQKSGVMAGEGWYAGQALVRIEQVKERLPG